MRGVVAVAAALLTVVASAPSSSGATVGPEWVSLGKGSVNNVSGIAASGSAWLIVRDNKKPGQNRLALVSREALVTPVTWPGTPPVDLEAVAAVPGAVGTFVVVASSGAAWLVTVTGSQASIARSFVIPGGLSNVEGFSLTQVGDVIVAVWASRGSTTSAAKLRVATFAPSTASFGATATGKVKVPYPTTSVRQVSDLALTGQRLLAVATSDPGSSGPFASAVYEIGTVTVSAGKAVIRMQTPIELGRFTGHKIEGLTCAGNEATLGSDDETAGGSIRTAALCPV